MLTHDDEGLFPPRVTMKKQRLSFCVCWEVLKKKNWANSPGIWKPEWQIVIELIFLEDAIYMIVCGHELAPKDVACSFFMSLNVRSWFFRMHLHQLIKWYHDIVKIQLTVDRYPIHPGLSYFWQQYNPWSVFCCAIFGYLFLAESRWPIENTFGQLPCRPAKRWPFHQVGSWTNDMIGKKGVMKRLIMMMTMDDNNKIHLV